MTVNVDDYITTDKIITEEDIKEIEELVNNSKKL